ncbi:class I SAM-dependent methyltransferase [Roseomonas sp. 18066]|uniref:class I SAM-dependent methyltransferase n=1 Tax=Roseomonas sp. 18066 TaxID=2681412 RepID=UPI00135BB3C9|nr:class I SAM-dependent methyltransferase [Roseomonas sp. 18066]
MNADYVRDLVYPAQFHREMTPAWIDAVGRGLGFAAPEIGRPFRWCELGCGEGLNALVVAASHPQAQVVAIDANAAAIAGLAAAAQAAGLRNLVALQAEFADLPEAGPGGFDFIVTHGVLSWVSDATRQAMLRFIDRALAPGGLVYAHYMTHPGLSAAVAAQQLVRRHAATGDGDSAQRVQRGLALLSQLSQAGAGFYTTYPQERQRLQAAAGQRAETLAHELLAAHWRPFHVAAMLDEMAGIGLDYRGSATPPDNIDAVSLPAASRPLLAGLADRATAETLRDLARNQALRRDLYQRGGASLAPAAHRQALDGLALAALPGLPATASLRFDTPIGPVEGDPALFGPILAALRQGPRRVGELARLPGFAPHPVALNQAVQMLLWSGCAHPVLQPLPDPAAGQAVSRGLSGWRVAPALGTALPVPDVVDAATRAQWVAFGAVPPG